MGKKPSPSTLMITERRNETTIGLDRLENEAICLSNSATRPTKGCLINEKYDESSTTVIGLGRSSTNKKKNSSLMKMFFYMRRKSRGVWAAFREDEEEEFFLENKSSSSVVVV